MAQLGDAALVEGAAGELDREDGAALRRRVGAGGQQPPARVGVQAEVALDARDADHELDLRRERERFKQRRARVAEPPGADQRGRLAGEQVGAGVAIAVRHEPQRRGEPVRRGRGRALAGGLRGGRQHRDRLGVADVRRTHHVEGPRRGPGAALLERRRDPLVRAQAPRGRDAVVDRAPHERVAEDERAPRLARGEGEAARAGRHGEAARLGRERRFAGRRRLSGSRAARRPRSAPAAAGSSSPVVAGRTRSAATRSSRARRAASASRSAAAAASSGSNGSPVTAAPSISARGTSPSAETSRPIAATSDAGSAPSARSADAGELAEEERVAAAFAHDPLADGGVGDAGQQRVGVVAAQRRELELLPPARAAGRVQQPAGRADRPRREHQQRRDRHRPAQQVQHQLQRGFVGPVQVVEQQRDGRQPLEPRRHGAVAAEALRHRRRRPARPPARRARRTSPRRGRRARARRRVPRRPAARRRVRARRSRRAWRSCRAPPRPAARAPGPNRDAPLRSRVWPRPAADRAPATP